MVTTLLTSSSHQECVLTTCMTGKTNKDIIRASLSTKTPLLYKSSRKERGRKKEYDEHKKENIPKLIKKLFLRVQENKSRNQKLFSFFKISGTIV